VAPPRPVKREWKSWRRNQRLLNSRASLKRFAVAVTNCPCLTSTLGCAILSGSAARRGSGRRPASDPGRGRRKAMAFSRSAQHCQPRSRYCLSAPPPDTAVPPLDHRPRRVVVDRRSLLHDADRRGQTRGQRRSRAARRRRAASSCLRSALSRRSSTRYWRIGKSVSDHGVKEPVVVTLDDYLVSGHRRRAAAIEAGLSSVPVQVEPIYRILDNGDINPEYVRLLVECNQQRVKSFDEVVTSRSHKDRSGRGAPSVNRASAQVISHFHSHCPNPGCEERKSHRS